MRDEELALSAAKGRRTATLLRRDLRGTWWSMGGVWLGRRLERLAWRVKGRPEAGAAIVVAGSGRAGTTWLAQLLSIAPGTQLIFEPLHPNFVPAVRALHDAPPPIDVLHATYVRPGEQYPAWEDFFRRVLTGELRNWWTDHERARRLAWRYVVKMIRASLMLGWLRACFGCPVVLILRHPCAVVCSRLARGWSAPVESFLGQPTLMQDHLAEFESVIRAAQSDVERHAVMWAVENLVALRQIQAFGGPVVFYETLCVQPIEQMRALYGELGLPFRSQTERAIHQRSLVRDERGRATPKGQVLGRWQHALSASDQRLVLDIVGRFGLSSYDEVRRT